MQSLVAGTYLHKLNYSNANKMVKKVQEDVYKINDFLLLLLNVSAS